MAPYYALGYIPYDRRSYFVKFSNGRDLTSTEKSTIRVPCGHVSGITMWRRHCQIGPWEYILSYHCNYYVVSPTPLVLFLQVTLLRECVCRFFCFKFCHHIWSMQNDKVSCSKKRNIQFSDFYGNTFIVGSRTKNWRFCLSVRLSQSKKKFWRNLQIKIEFGWYS